MKKIILLALFIGNLSFAQKITTVDSMVIKKVDSLVTLGARLWNTNLDDAETVAHYMLKFSEKHHYLKGQGQAFNSLASTYSNQGNQGKALLHYKKALTIFKTLKEYNLLNVVRYNVGVSFLDSKEYSEALKYLEKAHDYFLETNNNTLFARVNIAIGYIYLGTDRSLDEVISKMKKAETYSRISNDTISLSSSLNGQAEAYLNKNKNIAMAISASKEAIWLMKIQDPEDYFLAGYSYLMLSKAYWKKKEFKKALAYNDSSLVAYKTLQYYAGLNLTYESRKNILSSAGNYKEAFEVFELFSINKDTLNKEERSKKFSRMKVEYETDRIAAEKDVAEARAQLAETTNKQNKNYLIGSIVIAVLILLSSIFYFARLKTIKTSELVAAELRETQSRLVLEQKYKESELKALKAQMNPHFIFNALNSIQEYIVTNKKNEASDYLGRFADLIRRYLNHSDSRSISLVEEVESLQMYLDLEALRFEKELSYSISLSKTLDDETIHIPTMMIQPYLENAIRHGLLHKKGKRQLLVSFTKAEEGIVICVIEDNGVGRKRSVELNQKRDKNHKSFAEKATQERLDLINHGKERKVGVLITDLYKQDEPSGTKIILSIPIL